MKTEYKNLIFDLGGVLIELGEFPIPQKLLPADEKFTLMEWFSSPTAHQFERGEISSEQFAQLFIETLNIDISIEDFIEYFRKWPKRIFPNAVSLLEKLSKHYHLSVLSNCNEIHWPIMEYEFNILKHFNCCFSSHLIGATKPNDSAFIHVLENLKTQAEDVLFFDDNIENVRAANALGISAVQVNGIKAVEDYLFKNNLLV